MSASVVIRSDEKSLLTQDGRSHQVMAAGTFTIFAAMIGVAVSYSVVYLFHLALAVMCVVVAICAWNGLWVRRLSVAIHRFLYVFFCWYAVSISWSIEPLYTLAYLAYLSFGISVTLTTIYVARDEATLRSLLRLVGVVVGVEVFFSLLEIFTPFRLPISPYSSIVTYFGREPVINASTLEDRVVQQFLSSPTGFQWNPNDLAATLVIFLPFCLFHRSPALRFGGGLATLTTIFFTGSRASYMAVGVVLIVWAMAFSVRRALIGMVFGLTLAIASPIAVGVLRDSSNERAVQLATLGTVLVDYVRGGTDEGDSISLRRQLISNGLKALTDSNGLGVGGGASRAVQERAGGAAAELGSMHNFWVEVLVDAGVLIGTCFVVWYVWLAFRCYCVAMFTRRTTIRYVASSLTCAMAGFSVAMVSSSSVIYVLPMWLLYGLVCAVLNIDSDMRSRKSPVTL